MILHNNDRKIKFLSIIALVIAIVGMSLGFAAFSTTLSISSSASVTPSSDNFKITIYGFKDKDSIGTFDRTLELKDSYLVSNYGVSVYELGESAVINNTTHTISNIKLNFNDGNGEDVYFFIIKNEGKYDAYLDIDDFWLASYASNCIPLEDATESLVQSACESIRQEIQLTDLSSDFPLSSENKIPVGESVLLSVMITYYGDLADGPFDAEFDDFELRFSTVK